MAKSFEALHAEAIEIRDEVRNDYNTAIRVGDVIDDVIEKVEEGFPDLSAIAQAVSTAITSINQNLSEALADVAAASAIQNLYNVTTQQPLAADSFYDAAGARAAVPVDIRKRGLVITYATSAMVWKIEQFTATDLADWTTDLSWKPLQGVGSNGSSEGNESDDEGTQGVLQAIYYERGYCNVRSDGYCGMQGTNNPELVFLVFRVLPGKTYHIETRMYGDNNDFYANGIAAAPGYMLWSGQISDAVALQRDLSHSSAMDSISLDVDIPAGCYYLFVTGDSETVVTGAIPNTLTTVDGQLQAWPMLFQETTFDLNENLSVAVYGTSSNYSVSNRNTEGRLVYKVIPGRYRIRCCIENSSKAIYLSKTPNLYASGTYDLMFLFRIGDRANQIFEIELDVPDEGYQYLNLAQNRSFSTDSAKQFVVEYIGETATAAVKQSEKYWRQLPMNCPQIMITGDFPSNSSNEKTVQVEFRGLQTDRGSNFSCYAVLAWQGSASLGWPKKNLKMDLLDAPDGDSVKIGITPWVPQDAYHFKGEFYDAIHCRQLVGYRLFEQFLRTRPWNRRRPWQYASDFAAWRPELLNETGAMCHPDGFPVEIWFQGGNNDGFYGLFNMQLSKHRSNYVQEKNNTNHICFQLDVGSSLGGDLNWNNCEIRNPKLSGYDYDGGVKTPPDLNNAAVQAIIAFYDWAKTVTAQTSRAEIEQHILIPFFVDWAILQMTIDNWDMGWNNDMWISYDGGGKWSPALYDVDQSFGANNGTLNTDPTYDHGLSSNFNNALWQILILDIKERVQELYEKGILTADNIKAIYEDTQAIVGLPRLQREWERWPNCPTTPTADHAGNISSLEYYRSYVDTRISWLLSLKIGIPVQLNKQADVTVIIS
jgi:hypothetical protein